jgi:hypothetical protein
MVPRLAKDRQSVLFVPTTRPRESSGGSNQYEVVNGSFAGFTLQGKELAEEAARAERKVRTT